MQDNIVEMVREDLLRRSQVGIKKYSTTLDRNDLGLRDWLQHAYEECLDQANYLKRSIVELDKKYDKSVCLDVQDWSHTCADGCCYSDGTDVIINGKRVSQGDSTYDVAKDVLEWAGYKVEE